MKKNRAFVKIYYLTWFFLEFSCMLDRPSQNLTLATQKQEIMKTIILTHRGLGCFFPKLN